MEIDIRQLLRTAVRLWWLPVLTILVFGLVGVGAGAMLPKTYVANTQLLVPPAQTSATVISDGSPIETYKTLLTSGPVLDRVILELGLDISREELAGKIAVSVQPDTQIIQIEVTDSDAQLATDITNSLALNFETQVVDLTSGEFERNLDNLQAQSDGLQTQITVLNTQINELNTPENADNTEIQVEIDQLDRQRIQLAQNKSDIDAKIRTLTSQLSMAGEPIVVLDTAQVPENPNSSSVLLLGLLGAFLGALLGVALLVFFGLRDPKLRDEFQVVSQPVLARSVASGLTEAEIAMIVARLQSTRDLDSGSVVVVSARSSDVPNNIANELSAAAGDGEMKFVSADDLIESAAAVTTASQAAGALVYAEINNSRLDDLEEVDELLRSIQLPILGTILAK